MTRTADDGTNVRGSAVARLKNRACRKKQGADGLLCDCRRRRKVQVEKPEGKRIVNTCPERSEGNN